MFDKFTQKQIDAFKADLQVWFEDYEKEVGSGEWEKMLIEVFQAGYGDFWREIISIPD